MSKIIFEFDYFEEAQEIKDHIRLYEFKSALDEIHTKVRGKLKYGDTTSYPEEVVTLLEEIKQLAWFDD